MNYGQWRTLDNFEELLKPKYRPISEYWQGLAENEFHLYEVVFTEPNDLQQRLQQRCKVNTIQDLRTWLQKMNFLAQS